MMESWQGKKEEEACQDLNQIPQDQGRHYNSLATRAAQTCQSSIARWAQELFDYNDLQSDDLSIY